MQVGNPNIPRISIIQYRILRRLLIEQQAMHAYALAKVLGLHVSSVRSAMIALERKGLIEQCSLHPSKVGPMQKLYGVIGEEKAELTLEQKRLKIVRDMDKTRRRLAILSETLRELSAVIEE